MIMPLIIALISILVLTGLAYLMRRFASLKICPICAGVSLTWAWMLVGILTNNLQPTTYNVLIAILMGGSVVGIAYQLEKKLPAGRSPLLWKTLFIPVGFAAVWGVINQIWWLAAITVAGCGALAWVFLRPHGSTRIDTRINADAKQKVADLEKKMEECC